MSNIILAEEAKRVNEGLQDLVSYCLSKLDLLDIKEMSDEDLIAMRKLITLADDCMSYMQHQAEVMDEMNQKLDKLLSK